MLFYTLIQIEMAGIPFTKHEVCLQELLPFCPFSPCIDWLALYTNHNQINRHVVWSSGQKILDIIEEVEASK